MRSETQTCRESALWEKKALVRSRKEAGGGRADIMMRCLIVYLIVCEREIQTKQFCHLNGHVSDLLMGVVLLMMRWQFCN